MKKVSTILSHLTNQPQFRSLKQHACYKKYLSLLGAKWQKAIAFIYLQNKTLFVAVTHPGFKMELNYNKDILKGILTQLASVDETCKMLQAEHVVVFHSKYRSIIQEDRSSDTIPYYPELASEDFTIESRDEAIKAKFEAIKETIRAQQA
jgi:hypothetical protein